MTTNTLTRRISISAQTVDDARSVPTPRGTSLVLRTHDGSEIELPSKVQELLLGALAAVAEQGSVTIVQTPDELTSTVAAQLLGVSRPTLMKWAQEGSIASYKVGAHTRFRRVDVLQLRDNREEARRAAFAELRALDAEDTFGLFED